MEQIIRTIVALIMRVWSFVFTYDVSQRIRKVRNVFYSEWIGHFFCEVGRNSTFAYPLLLEGGGQRRIKIGSHTCIGHRTVLGCWTSHGKNDFFDPEIIIGNHCSIGEYNHITAIQKIIIGDGLLTGRFVYIGDNAHGGLSWKEADIPPSRRHLISKGIVRIGNNVWIGDKTTVLGGVTIGDNVIIGAGSIITHDIPSNSMAVGAPAKVIRQLQNL